FLQDLVRDALSAFDAAFHKPGKLAGVLAGEENVSHGFGDVIGESRVLSRSVTGVRTAHERRTGPVLPDRLPRKRFLGPLVNLIDLRDESCRALLERPLIEILPQSSASKIGQDCVVARLSAAGFPTALEREIGKRVTRQP